MPATVLTRSPSISSTTSFNYFFPFMICDDDLDEDEKTPLLIQKNPYAYSPPLSSSNTILSSFPSTSQTVLSKPGCTFSVKLALKKWFTCTMKSSSKPQPQTLPSPSLSPSPLVSSSVFTASSPSPSTSSSPSSSSSLPPSITTTSILPSSLSSSHSTCSIKTTTTSCSSLQTLPKSSCFKENPPKNQVNTKRWVQSFRLKKKSLSALQ